MTESELDQHCQQVSHCLGLDDVAALHTTGARIQGE